MKVQEQGRRLVIDLEDEDESIVFKIPPVSAITGASLLTTFVGVNNAARSMFGGEAAENDADIDKGSTDLAQISLGRPVFLDPENPTERESARLADFEDLWAKLNDPALGIRQEEINQIVMSAFYWQVIGGGIKIAKMAGEEGDLPKAEAAWMQSAGLARSGSGTNTAGDEGSKTPAPDASSDTSSPASSATLSKLPPEKRSINQNQ